MRASDADRDRVADQLREALAEGRLTPEEHGERIDAVYAAKTYADLVPIVDDLPITTPTSARTAPVVRDEVDLPAPSPVSPRIAAIFGGAERKGRWLVEPHISVLTAFGGVQLDLRQAVLAQREVTINIVCLFGGVEIKVPPGVRVINSCVAIFGGSSVPPDDTDDPNAPIVRLTGFVMFGGVEAERRSGHLNSGHLNEVQGRVQRDELRESQREQRRDR